MPLLRKSIPLFFIFCITSAITLCAQNRKLDSLNQLIATAGSDTARINLMNKKIAALSNITLDSAIYYGLQNMDAAQKIKYYRGELDARMKLVSNYCFKGNYEAATAALIYLENFIVPGKDSVDIADLYGSYGMMYGLQSKYDSSILFYQKAIGVNERNNNSDRLAANYSNIAIGYQQTANYPKALEYQQKGLKLAEERKNETSQAFLLVNLANTYTEIGDTVKAEQIFLKAAALGIKKDMKNIELYTYTNLSSLYTGLRNWDKAYEFGIKAATLAHTFGDQGIQAASLSKAAAALARQDKFEEATLLDKQAMLIADSSNQPLNISQAYSAMGTILFLQNKYKEAIPFYEKGFRALQGSDIYSQGIMFSYKELSECYEKTGAYAKALTNFKIAADIADSIKRKENIRKATELSMNFEFEKKQEIQAAEKARDAELARTKQRALLIGLVVAGALALVALRGYLHKQKANKLLLLQKQKTELALSELKSTQAQLIQSEKMAGLGELTAGIAHEIQNPLNFINNFSEVNNELIAEINYETDLFEIKSIIDDVKQNLEKINHHGKRAESIVKGMLQHSRLSTGKKEPTDINKLCDEYLRLSYHGLRAKDKSFNAHFKTDFDDTIEKINIVPQDMGRVFLNIMNNAFYAVSSPNPLKGEQWKPLVSVSTRKIAPLQGMGAKVEIKITDNGNGIPQNIIDKIFQPFFTTKPTGQGTGLGLSLSYDIVKAHGGEINVKTMEREGTEFIIQLPFNP